MPRSCGGGKTATDENAPKKNEKELDQRWEFMKENKKVRKSENTPSAQKTTKKTRKNDNDQEEKKENTLSTQKATKKKKLPFFS